MTFYGFVNTIITMIPVVDQAADIRDIVAGIKVLAWDRKYNDYMVWIGICFTIIGLFPTAGSLAKGVLKCVFKSLPIARIVKVFNGLAEGNVVRYLKMLGDGGLDTLHRQTLEQFNKLVAAVRGKLNRIKALVPDRLKDAHASLNRFIDGLDQAKRHAPDMIARFFDDLWQKLEDILGGPRLDNAMSGPTNSTLIRKQARADAPKLEMVGEKHGKKWELNEPKHKKSIGKSISKNKQNRHLKGSAPGSKGYLDSEKDAQEILDAFHSGDANVDGRIKLSQKWSFKSEPPGDAQGGK